MCCSKVDSGLCLMRLTYSTIVAHNETKNASPLHSSNISIPCTDGVAS
jgi:hypothetical protein